MFKIVAVICFINIYPGTNMCFYNAEAPYQIKTFEACNQLIDTIVPTIDQPLKDKNVAIYFNCTKIPSTPA
jgi:hypothetical protein